MRRRRDAERTVVLRGHTEVVGDARVVEPHPGKMVGPVAVIAGGHRHSGRDFLLHFRRKVPQVVAAAETPQQIVRKLRGSAGSPEVQIGDLPALSVRLVTVQVAVGNEIAVGVSPRAVHDVHGGSDRVGGLRDVGPDCTDVASQRDLERRTAIAEQVVRRAEPRVDVLPVRHVGHLIEVARERHELGGRDVLGGHQPVVVIEPHAVIEGQAVDDPLILRVEAKIQHIGLQKIGSRQLVDSERPAPQKCVAHVPGHSILPAELVFLDLEACLEGMGPGDVGDRESLGVDRLVRQVEARARVVPKPGRRLEDGDVVRSGLHRPGIGGRHQRRTGFEQQPVVDRHRPRGLSQHIGPEKKSDDGFRRREVSPTPQRH